MPASMEVILLERVENLGGLGDRVSVKPGYARNFLLPQSKALRATKNNIAYFETQKKEIEKQNEANKKEAEKLAKNFDGMKIVLVRLASESGQLYGSVTAKDIADAVGEQSKETIMRNQVEINQAYKNIGLFPLNLILHPEVKVEITVNIARSEAEAKIQEKTGKAVITTHDDEPVAKEAPANEDKKEELLEESALEAEKAKAEEAALKAAEEEEKARLKAEAKAAKEAAAAAEEEPAEETAEAEKETAEE